jgi:hypothetical protein
MSPGRPLREYLGLSDGAYVFDMPVSAVDRQRLREIAELTGDEGLCGIATDGSVPISLNHLRGCDADQTLVRVGYLISYSQEEVRELGLDSRDP